MRWQKIMKKKVDSLQVLRGLGFLSIFSAHAGLTRLGPFGVSLFFVLSGFVLMNSQEKDVEDGGNKGFRNACFFMYKKISRLYPLHFVMLLVAIPLVGEISLRVYLSMVVNAILLQTWIPFSDFYFSFNSVSWFLSVCVFLYLIFPFIARLVKNIKLRLLVPVGGDMVDYWITVIDRMAVAP